MSIDDEKRALRAAATEQRRQATVMAGPDAATWLADAFMAVLDDIAGPIEAPDPVISGYWPMADEMDIRSLLIRLNSAGRPLALPVVLGAGKALLFRRWQPGDLLADGVFGTRHPKPENAEVAPAIVLAPLLAFDAEGGRIGWGAGYYDRTLAGLRAAGQVVAVGVAFAGQQVARVPMTERDQALDWVVTEAGALPVGP